MKHYFEAKLKYNKLVNGSEKRVTETFVIEAVNFTDAEIKMTKFGQQICKGEFQVKDIRQSKVESILSVGGEKVFKAKVTVLSVDEDAGREKKIISYWLVFADDFYDAHKKVQIETEAIIVPAEIESLALTPIVDLIQL